METALAKAIPHPRGAARPVQDRSTGCRRPSCRQLAPAFDWNDLSRARIGHPRHRGAQRHRARLLPGDERRAEASAARRLEALPALAPGQQPAPVPVTPPSWRRTSTSTTGYLRGVPRSSPRAGSAASRWVDRDLGEALGQVFVRKNFPPELKADDACEMVRQIERAMEARHPDARLDGAGDQAASALRSSTPCATRSATRTAGATTRRSSVARGDFTGNVDRAVALRVARGSSPRSASRSTAASGA